MKFLTSKASELKVPELKVCVLKVPELGNPELEIVELEIPEGFWAESSAHFQGYRHIDGSFKVSDNLTQG